LFCSSLGSANDSNTIDIDDLGWLAGEWVGEGQEGEDGKVEGVALQYWTPPLEGSVSFFFTWHAKESKHVHYAVNVFQQTENGVTGKGIHYGRDFENFEEHPWHLSATRISSNFVEFQCLKYCRSEIVSFTLLENGVLEERWKHNANGDRPDWIVRYRRAD